MRRDPYGLSLFVFSRQIRRNLYRKLASLAVCVGAAVFAAGQGKPVPPQTAPIGSLAATLQRGDTELHFIYVHGMAAAGSTDFDSWGLRHGICQALRCKDSEWKDNEPLVYPDQPPFVVGSSAPDVKYLGKQVWNSPTEWAASAPYMKRWHLKPDGDRAMVYVDEINWWPLIFALKCQQIIADDVTLPGPDKKKIAICSGAKNPEASCADEQQKPDGNGRFINYPFLTCEEAKRLLAHKRHGAILNRNLKTGFEDWGFSDVMLAVGEPMRGFILDGIRQLVRRSIHSPADEAPGSATPNSDEEFIIVTHSLGSYLIFAALDSSDIDPNTKKAASTEFNHFLGQTSHVYFFANQLRLLELANLGEKKGAEMNSHLAAWGAARCRYLNTKADARPKYYPQLVAWNDASDLLTWKVPEGPNVKNIQVRNATDWFGLFENPMRAHDGYARNKTVIRKILASDSESGTPCPLPSQETGTSAGTQ